LQSWARYEKIGFRFVFFPYFKNRKKVYTYTQGIYMYIYTCTYMYVHEHIYTYIFIYMHIYIYKYIHVYICIQTTMQYLQYRMLHCNTSCCTVQHCVVVCIYIPQQHTRIFHNNTRVFPGERALPMHILMIFIPFSKRI